MPSSQTHHTSRDSQPKMVLRRALGSLAWELVPAHVASSSITQDLALRDTDEGPIGPQAQDY